MSEKLEKLKQEFLELDAKSKAEYRAFIEKILKDISLPSDSGDSHEADDD